MLRNTAGQTFEVIAFNVNGRVSGDAANITCNISNDDGTPTPLSTNVANEIGTTGIYRFSLSQEETDCYKQLRIVDSSTSGVEVVAIPNVVYTDEDGVDLVDPSLGEFSEAYGPKKVQTPNMTVEQFDPLTIQRARDRENSGHPTLGSMHFTVASPDHCKYYERRKTR